MFSIPGLRQAGWPLAILFRTTQARAASEPGFMPLVTDGTAHFTPASLPEPPYLMISADPVLGTRITRISGATGMPVGALPETWAPIARHVYSTQPPWKSTMALLSIVNQGNGEVLLHGQTYQPVGGVCAN